MHRKQYYLINTVKSSETVYYTGVYISLNILCYFAHATDLMFIYWRYKSFNGQQSLYCHHSQKIFSCISLNAHIKKYSKQKSYKHSKHCRNFLYDSYFFTQFITLVSGCSWGFLYLSDEARYFCAQKNVTSCTT
jgi:hypothetical protein